MSEAEQAGDKSRQDTGARLLAGRYRLGKVLGRGGMGTVWRAEDEMLGRTVAIKELRFPSSDEDEKRRLIARTLREAKAIARIRDRSAVTVFDVVEEDDRPWIVMELIEGRSLAEVIREDGVLTPKGAAEVGLAVLNVLRAAHSQGILHRDVKPSNVLMAEDGRVVLTDFGIAQVEGDPSITSTGMLVGAPSYISPERARGQRPGPAADLWSLGALLYACVEGVPPYDKGSAIATLTAVMTDPLERPRNAGPLEEVIGGLLAKDADQRLDDTTARVMLQGVVDGTGGEDTATTAFAMPPAGRRAGRGDGTDATPVDPAAVAAGAALAAAGEASGREPGVDPATAQDDAAHADRDVPSDRTPADSGREAGGDADDPAPGTAVPDTADGQAADTPAGGSAGPASTGTTPSDVVDPRTAVPAPPEGAPEAPNDSAAYTADPAPATPHDTPADASGGADLPTPGRDAGTEHGEERAAFPSGNGQAPPYDAGPATGTAAPVSFGKPARDDAASGGAASHEESAAGGSEAPVVDTAMPGFGPALAQLGQPETQAPDSGTPSDGAFGPATGATGYAESTGAPRPPGTDPYPATGPSARPPAKRRAMVIAAVLVALAVLGTVLALTLTHGNGDDTAHGKGDGGTSASGGNGTGGDGGEGGKGTGDGSGQHQDPGGSDGKTSGGSGDEGGTGGTGGTGEGGAVRTYKDPSGFSIGLPEGWTVKNTDRTGVHFTGPDQQELLVGTTDSPKVDPVADWKQQESNIRSSMAHYDRVRIEPVRYRSWLAADWEFTFDRDGTTLRRVDRGFIVNPHRGYGIMYTAKDDSWDSDARRTTWNTFTDTFQPKP